MHEETVDFVFASVHPNHKDESYDETPYPAAPYAQSHPSRLGAIATLFGMQPAAVDSCRVLEIGCADGSNLIPMAANLPGSQFLGVDLSQVQVSRAQKVARQLALANIQIRCQGIEDLERQSEPFDYIIAHGVFSWVPRHVQESILATCQQQLAPNGIAYISYNTFPGWRMRGLLRDMMLFHTRNISDATTKVSQARALIQFLSQVVASEEDPYGQLIQAELKEMRTWDDNYFRHDSLEEVNEPVYFHEFIERAANHDLQYLGEAEVETMLLENQAPEVSSTLARVAANIVEREQYMDFVRNRMFRQTLLCRREVKLQRGLSSDRIQQLHATSDLKPTSPAACPDDESESFSNENGVSVTVNNRRQGSALRSLAECWPGGITVSNLVKDCYERERVTDPDESTIASDRRALGAMLLRLYVKGLVQFHSWYPPLQQETAANLKVSQLALLQARNGLVVTNLLHEHIALDKLHQQTLLLLNGNRDKDAILDALVEKVRRDEIRMEIDDSRVGVDEARQILAARVPQCIRNLARHALLMR